MAERNATGDCFITPPALEEGSLIAIISPATVVKGEYVEGAATFLREQGYEVMIMPHALGPSNGSYASAYENRLADFLTAWRNPEVSAVLCARGGYGAAHLLPELPVRLLRENAKWLIGFSDISALHAALLKAGVMSIHGPMAKHLVENPENAATRKLMALLRGGKMDYVTAGDPRNISGEAEGVLSGGNLAVLDGLSAGPFDVLGKAGDMEGILFIEDIAEPVYKVERMLWRLYLSGTLMRLKGLIVGHFTEYKPDINHGTMENMIDALLRRVGLNIPVAFNYPVGHVDDNLPLVEGARVRLETTKEKVRLKQL